MFRSTPPQAQGAQPPLTSSAKTKIDTFSITALAPIKAVHALIEEHLPAVEIHGGTPPKNFSGGARIVLNGQNIGWTGWGSTSGRSLLYIDGAGCRLIARTGFTEVQAAIAELDGARYTRVDIASDTYEGEVGTSSILKSYEDGGFRCGRARKNPQQKIIQSRDAQGRTLGSTIYIGADGATKLARCYEKGLQLFGKNPASNITKAATARALKSVPGQLLVAQLGEGWKEKLDGWYRVEIQFRHDKDRPLRLDMLTRADEFFAGAYPICEVLLPYATPLRPDYVPDDAEAKLLVQLGACRSSYGGLLRTLLNLGLDAETLVDLLAADKPSRKLREAGIENIEEFAKTVREMAAQGVLA